MALILNTCGAGQTRLLGHGFSVGTKRSSDWCKLKQYEASHRKGMKPPSTDEMRPPDAWVSCQLTKVNKGEAPALRPEPGVGQFSGGRVPSGHLSSCKGGWCSPSEIVFRPSALARRLTTARECNSRWKTSQRFMRQYSPNAATIKRADQTASSQASRKRCLGCHQGDDGNFIPIQVNERLAHADKEGGGSP